MPEVVFFVQAENAVFRNPSHFLPQRFGLIIFAKNRYVEPVLGYAVFFGDQFPGKRNGIALEIVAERKIAQHFKERMMTARVADVIQIVVLSTRPYAFLRRRCTDVIALFLSQKNVFELIHACVGEQQSGVVRGH